MTEPVALRPRSNDTISWPTSVAGSTVGVASPDLAVPVKTVAPPDASAGSWTFALNAAASVFLSDATAASTSFCVIRGKSVLVPPVVTSGLLTLRVIGSSPLGMIRIVFGSTLLSLPPSTAVTLTVAVEGMMVRPTRSARASLIVASVWKRMPPWVLTMLPAGTVLGLRKSRFSKRTIPVALVTSVRLPVAGNVPLALTSRGTFTAGTTKVVASGTDAVGSATTVNENGPRRSVFGVTAMVAEGRSR